MFKLTPRAWLNTLFLLGTLVLALVLVPWKLAVQGLRLSEVVVFLVMYSLIGLSITVGYHRLFSHRAFRASWPVRLVALLLGAAAFQNSALAWCSDHRHHHRFVDDVERDPYPVRRGFWYAHWIWVLEAKDRPMDSVGDLEQDPLIRWQHRYHFWIGAAVAALPVLAVGLMTHNIFGQLVICLLLRIVVTHHSTFLINSAAHWFGTQPYTDANSARDNAILAPFTCGSGTTATARVGTNGTRPSGSSPPPPGWAWPGACEGFRTLRSSGPRWPWKPGASSRYSPRTPSRPGPS
jgi:stearoyl-CoA desaturase (delta-9 desaturase)